MLSDTVLILSIVDLACVIAYYDYQKSTIRHIHCSVKIPPTTVSKRCDYCRAFRDNFLRKSLSRLLKSQQQGQLAARCDVYSHTNYRYLTTPEKIQRMHNMHNSIRLSKRKISDLQGRLDRLIQVDGIKVDEATHNGLLSILMKHQQRPADTADSFSSIFWQQQLKAASVKDQRGMRWHPAIIRWCLYLHHKSSGCYSTLRNTGVLTLPSERTLRDYKHSSPSMVGFSKELDLELYEAVSQQRPQHLAKYVGLVLDEMYVKEGLFFNKHTGELIGYADLGEINNLLSDYEQKLTTSDTNPRPLGKCMLMFMIREQFTSLKFPYVQFPAANTKGSDIFPLVRQAIKHLTRIGLFVTTITCDGASDNRRMFAIFNSKETLSYKTINVFCTERREIFFISDPPHLLKTIRNCFARGKLWVCRCHF